MVRKSGEAGTRALRQACRPIRGRAARDYHARVALPLVLLSGFEAFERVQRNPSGALARALAARPPRGWRVAGVVLPVSFARAPHAWDRRHEALTGRPALLLAMGVSKEASFRLERLGRPRLRHVARPDVDGELPARHSRRGPALATSLDLARLARALRRRGLGPLRVSRSAGGYVCERLYHHVLVRGGRAGIPALFLHVPPLARVPLAVQLDFLRALLDELGSGYLSRSGSSRSRGRPAGSVGGRAAKARTAAMKGSSSRPM